jgi:hypothetical protein
MKAMSITSMSTPDAVEAPRDLRPLRSRRAGPRGGRSLVLGAGVGAVIGVGLAGTRADGASAAASSTGPCA